MYHHDFTRSLMRERTRERIAEARADRAGRLARRAREFWAERADRVAARPERPASRRAAPMR